MRGKTAKRLKRVYRETDVGYSYRRFKKEFLKIPRPMRYEILNIIQKEN